MFYIVLKVKAGIKKLGHITSDVKFDEAVLVDHCKKSCAVCCAVFAMTSTSTCVAAMLVN